MNNLNEVLVELAKHLGTSTKYLWDALLRQAFISGISDLLFIIVTIIATLLFIKWYKQKHNDLKESYDEIDDPFYFVLSTIGFVFLGGTYIIILCNIPNILAAFFNPQYWALHEIMSKL